MSVLVPFPIETVEQEQELPTRTYKLDLDRGRIEGFVDELEAVNQAIMKALMTPRFRCAIYDNQIGSEIKELIIAGDASSSYIEAEIPRMVKDALSPDTRILRTYNYEFSFEGEAVYISFNADTVYGTTRIEVVI